MSTTLATAVAWGRRKEPAVISTSLIAASLEEEERRLQTDPNISYATYVPTAVHAAGSLRLSYKNLISIQNLESLRSLVELRLDNNAIANITGLDHCTKLERLDLSFNKISRIQGLEHLTHLTDLTLAHNDISRLEGLEACCALELLSIGHNRLCDLRDIMYLRKLPKLAALSMDGNPFCAPGYTSGGPAVGSGGTTATATATAAGLVTTTTPTGSVSVTPGAAGTPYRSQCLAFLRLQYLDYQLVTAADERAAREGGVSAEQLAEFEEAVALTTRAAEKAAAKQATLEVLRAAHLEAVELLLEEMLGEDPELDKLRNVSGLGAAIEEYRGVVAIAGAVLREAGLVLHARVEESAAELRGATASAVALAEAAPRAAAREWERSAKRARRGEHAAAWGPSSVSGAEEPAPLLEPEELLDLAHEQGEQALSVELRTHEAVQNSIDAFEGALGELKASKLAAHETYFRAVENHQSVFNAAVRALADDCQALAHRDPESLDDDLLALVSDRDALNGAVGGSHEAHLTKLLRWESRLREGEEKRCVGLLAGLRAAEHARNRARVQEIRRIVAAAELTVQSMEQL